jgi:nicotinamidase-related amidase
MNNQASNNSFIGQKRIAVGLLLALMLTQSAVAVAAISAAAQNPAYAEPEKGSLPASDMQLDPERVALVVVDPQNDFLHEEGVAWGVVGQSVTEHNVVQHLEDLLSAAKRTDMPVFISPHYYYPHDHKWKFEGTLEKVMHSIGMFDRPGPLDTSGLNGSGADFVERFKPYLNDDKTVITSPHKVYGPEQNDLFLQLRKQRIDQVILAGMSANLCVESHMRALLEAGFEVAVVKDATAGAIVPEGDGYLAALINFRMIANGVWSTDETVEKMDGLVQ